MIAEEEVPAIAKPKQQRLGAIVRNRRFKKLQLLRMGDYFSEEAIKLRHVRLSYSARHVGSCTLECIARSIHKTSQLNGVSASS